MAWASETRWDLWRCQGSFRKKLAMFDTGDVLNMPCVGSKDFQGLNVNSSGYVGQCSNYTERQLVCLPPRWRTLLKGTRGGAEGDQTHDHQLRNRVNEVLTV